MQQTELNKFLSIKQLSLKQLILKKIQEGKTEQEICNELKLSKGAFYRLKKKLNVKNPNSQTSKQSRRIHLRKQGLPIAKIAEKEGFSEQAIYQTLKIHAPELLSEEFWSQIIRDSELIKLRSKSITKITDLTSLIKFRKQGYSIGAQVTYQRFKQEKLWYIYASSCKKTSKFIGRIPRILLLELFPESLILEKEATKGCYLSLNPILNKLIKNEKKSPIREKEDV